MEEKYLPIGTVVLLKNGTKEVMITCYGIMPEGDIIEAGEQVSGKGKMYDYGGCTYPEGMVSSDNLVIFNHDKIEKICYKGYETDAYKEFNETLKKALPEIEKNMQNKENTEEVKEEGQ